MTHEPRTRATSPGRGPDNTAKLQRPAGEDRVQKARKKTARGFHVRVAAGQFIGRMLGGGNVRFEPRSNLLRRTRMPMRRPYESTYANGALDCARRNSRGALRSAARRIIVDARRTRKKSGGPRGPPPFVALDGNQKSFVTRPKIWRPSASYTCGQVLPLHEPIGHVSAPLSGGSLSNTKRRRLAGWSRTSARTCGRSRR